MENNEVKKKEVEKAVKILEEYISSGIKSPNLSTARSTISDFLADEVPRRLRGGGCYTCGFEKWYYEVLTGSQAKERFSRDHQQQHPTCTGEFACYGGSDEEVL
jgi:hypothetical protein